MDGSPEPLGTKTAKPTLYHYWRSSSSWRVRWALMLKGVDFEAVAVNLLRGEQQAADYVAKNPQGLVPLLTLPWSLYLPAALRRLRGADARALLWPWWAASLLLFFSLPSSKLVGYALPALPGVAGLVALVAAEGRHWRVAALLGAAIGLTAVGVLAWQAPNSHRDIAQALRSEMHGADRVVLVEGAFYDVPFYAQLRTPAIVASRWDDPAIAQRDNWQKELHDAAGFASAATAQRQLWPVDRLAELPCTDGAIWFVLHPGDSHQVAAIPGATRVLKGANGDLWRAPERATCAAAPR
jgi:hypothetical protein